VSGINKLICMRSFLVIWYSLVYRYIFLLIIYCDLRELYIVVKMSTVDFSDISDDELFHADVEVGVDLIVSGNTIILLTRSKRY